MNIDDKIAELKADIEECELVRTTTAINSIRDAALRKANDCKQMLEWLEDYKTVHETVRAMREDIMKLQTYKMFPYEDTVYIKRDEVLKIFEKYTEGDEGNEKHNCT